MFILHIDLKTNPGSEGNLEKMYHEVFLPAISGQEGLSHVDLLRPNEREWDYRLTIAFHQQALQQRWVATELHQQVWPQIEGHCETYSVRHYTSV